MSKTFSRKDAKVKYKRRKGMSYPLRLCLTFMLCVKLIPRKDAKVKYKRRREGITLCVFA
jgi:hypothetical protein